VHGIYENDRQSYLSPADSAVNWMPTITVHRTYSGAMAQ